MLTDLRQHRLNWTVDPISGAYQTSAPTKTGVAADVQLASYGTDQAAQLATKITTIDPPPDVLYSSPWYRCVQTIAPAVEALIAQEKTDGVLRIENGFGSVQLKTNLAPGSHKMAWN